MEEEEEKVILLGLQLWTISTRTHVSTHICMCVHTSHTHNIVMMLTYASISFAHHKHVPLGATKGQLCKVNYLDFI